LAEGSLEATSKTERKTQSRYWTPDEHKRFLEGLARFGHKDMKAIARFVGTRSPTQVRTHAQKYYLKLAREAAKRQTNQYYRVDSSNLALASGTNPRKTDEYYATKSASESLSGTKAMNDDISDSANENFVFSDRIFNSTSLYMTNLDQDSNFGEAIANSEGILEWMNSDT
jgi:SHAQKYF class myb-like DNA-binding protein